jgi:hypothetical protein
MASSRDLWQPGSLPPNVDLCGAKCRDGHACEQPAMANGRCRMHGGLSPKGAANGNFSSGRYSKYLPIKLMERYHDALGSMDLLSLRDDIALLDTRIQEQLQKTETPEGESFWKVVQELGLELFDYLDACQKDPESFDFNTAKRMASQVVETANSALRTEDTWKDIRDLIETKRKVAETEHSRLVKAKQVMSIDEAMTVIAILLDSVKRNVQDKAALSAISADIARVVDAPSSRRA